MDFCVIPLEVYARNVFPVEVFLDCLMVCEDSSEVVKVVVTYILDSEIINNEYKHNGAPFVAPKPWRSGGFVVSSIIKARAE